MKRPLAIEQLDSRLFLTSLWGDALPETDGEPEHNGMVAHNQPFTPHSFLVGASPDGDFATFLR